MAGLRLHPDTAAMPLDYLLTKRQADAGPWIVCNGMQALEDDENAVRILWIDTDPIITDREPPFLIVSRGREMHARWRRFLAEFYGVADEVLKELNELGAVPHDRGKRIMDDDCLLLLDHHFEII